MGSGFELIVTKEVGRPGQCPELSPSALQEPVGAPGLPSEVPFFCWHYEQLSPLRSTELGTSEDKRVGTEDYKCSKMREGRVHIGRAGLWPLRATADFVTYYLCDFYQLLKAVSRIQ